MLKLRSLQRAEAVTNMSLYSRVPCLSRRCYPKGQPKIHPNCQTWWPRRKADEPQEPGKTGDAEDHGLDPSLE